MFPVDISDPANPKLLASWTFQSQTHGGSTTEDGTRSYICQQYSPPNDKLLIVDTSEVAAREPDPRPRLLAQIPLDDNQWCQAAYRVTYDGHPFLIQYGERSGAADCSRSEDNWANFGYPRIFDLADERHPKLVSARAARGRPARALRGGDRRGRDQRARLQRPPLLARPPLRPDDPRLRLLRRRACACSTSATRTTRSRSATSTPAPTSSSGPASRPVVRAERGEIWFVNDVGGFYVVRFDDGIWPFEDSPRCPEFDDYYYAQYNPGSTCRDRQPRRHRQAGARRLRRPPAQAEAGSRA